MTNRQAIKLLFVLIFWLNLEIVFMHDKFHSVAFLFEKWKQSIALFWLFKQYGQCQQFSFKIVLCARVFRKCSIIAENFSGDVNYSLAQQFALIFRIFSSLLLSLFYVFIALDVFEKRNEKDFRKRIQPNRYFHCLLNKCARKKRKSLWIICTVRQIVH